MHSQLGQDLWILESTNFQTHGYFIEIGAYDGVYHSNTYLLEKKYSWTGICVEPSIKYNELIKNRKCNLSNCIVYNKSNCEVDFYETPKNMELCGIPNHFKQDGHQNSRSYFNVKKIQTISLTDLCEKYNAPKYIDYLSIDTEGSELYILEHHDFEKYRFKYITIEHNRSQDYREKIQEFLNTKGYFLDNSERFNQVNINPETNFDDWYIYKL